MAKGIVRTGTAGWVFAPWRGAFYPDGPEAEGRTGLCQRALGAIEINATFYSLPEAAELSATGPAETPDGFVFSVKGHQLVTHIKRLKDVEIPLANFFASGPLALGEQLGPFCWQLPRQSELRRRAHRGLPRAAAQDAGGAPRRLPARHDEGLKDSRLLDTTGISAIRHAIEVRHESFANPDFIAQLRAHNVALVIADTAEWPYLDQTADFAYCRLQGAPGARQLRAGRPRALGEAPRRLGRGDADDRRRTSSPNSPKPRRATSSPSSSRPTRSTRRANAMAVAERLRRRGVYRALS